MWIVAFHPRRDVLSLLIDIEVHRLRVDEYVYIIYQGIWLASKMALITMLLARL